MQDIVASLVLRKRVTVSRTSSCSSHAVQLAARRDMNFFESFSLAIQHGLRSTSSQETALTPAYSKSMGPPAPLRRPQPGRPRSLCRLLHPLPHPQPQAAEVRYSVRYLFLYFLDLERHSSSLPHTSALPRFLSPGQSRLSSSFHLPCRRSKKMVCALSYPRHHRHCCPTWPSSPRDDPAPDAKGPPDHKLKACPSRQTARPLRLQLLSRHQPDLFASSALQV